MAHNSEEPAVLHKTVGTMTTNVCREHGDEKVGDRGLLRQWITLSYQNGDTSHWKFVQIDRMSNTKNGPQCTLGGLQTHRM